MTLRELTQNLPGLIQIVGNENTQINALCTNSKKVSEGALFFCIPGLRVDAHDFAPQAVKGGAAALVVNHVLDLNVPQVVVEDVRMATSYMACAFYGHPSRSMKMIGLTGTKGKTTTSFLVKSVLEEAGYKTGLVGTVCCMIGNETLPANLTTPDPLELQALLRKMADAGCTHVVMEVSAHAIDMQRLAGMVFEVGAFSNFSQDHLDYFGTMDNYFAAKMRFFEGDMVKKVVYNPDDERVAAGFKKLGREALRAGIREASDFYANDIEINEKGTTFTLKWHKTFETPVNLQLSGIFNVYNALMAAGICSLLGVKETVIAKGLSSIPNVPGRIELLDTETPYRVILDYAHSPDSLENILKALRETTRGRLIALFGCGGNRDTAKRPVMGEIGGQLSDYCVLTSDNPRYEDPFEILAEVESGMKKTDCEYIVIENRREAIRYALEMAKTGDVVVLAGKGHETYQEICGVKHPFDEKVVVAELLEEMRIGER